MFCWQARRRFADLMEAGRGSSLAGARAHVDTCQDCRDELQALSGVAEMVGAEARAWPGSTPLTDPIAFERAVFQRARAARRHPAGDSTPFAAPPPRIRRWPSMLPVASAAAIMVLAVATSLLVGTPSPDVISQYAPDRVAPPSAIPFTIMEDLVGARTGTIPATTYVLEPAPVDEAVMRASL